MFCKKFKQTIQCFAIYYLGKMMRLPSELEKMIRMDGRQLNRTEEPNFRDEFLKYILK